MIGLEEWGFRIPKRGWSGRRRAIARAWLQIALMVIGVALFLAGVRLVVIVAWAAALPEPR